MFHSFFFNSLARPRYLSILPLSLKINIWSTGTAKSKILQVLLYFYCMIVWPKLGDPFVSIIIIVNIKYDRKGFKLFLLACEMWLLSTKAVWYLSEISGVMTLVRILSTFFGNFRVYSCNLSVSTMRMLNLDSLNITCVQYVCLSIA